MKKIWHDEAWEEYVYWQTQDKKTLKQIYRLLQGSSSVPRPPPKKGRGATAK